MELNERKIDVYRKLRRIIIHRMIRLTETELTHQKRERKERNEQDK